jgi:hypothetical protein
MTKWQSHGETQLDCAAKVTNGAIKAISLKNACRDFECKGDVTSTAHYSGVTDIIDRSTDSQSEPPMTVLSAL